MHGTSSFSKRSVGSVALAALLIFGVYTIMPLTSGAYAQGAVTITTSADAHNGKFYGPALLEVMFQSSQHAADNTPGTVQVTVTAFGTSQQYTLQETSGTSGIFLLYVKVDKDDSATEEPEVPANPFSSTNTRLYVGPTGVADNYPATTGDSVRQSLEVTGSNINEGGTIQFSFGGVTKTITYDDTPATLTLDRTTYGPDSKVYATIYDPDINLDPTTSNKITETVPEELLSRIGVTPTTELVFTETGSNTGKFEAELMASGTFSGSSVGRSLTATDYKDFVGVDAINVEVDVATPQGTSSASYTVQRVSGSMGQLSGITYSSELPITVNDLDQNTDSKSQQSLTGELRINEPSQVNAHNFNLREQSTNSNIFVPAYGQDRILLTWKQPTSAGQGILKLLPGQEATIRYEDHMTSTGTIANTSSITIKPSNTAPKLSTDKTTVGRSSVIVLTMEDPELNDDAAIIESYTVVFDKLRTNSTKAEDFNGVSPFSMKIDRDGNPMALTDDFAVTFTETGPNTGVFVAEVDLADLGDVLTGNGDGKPLADGHTIKIEVKDTLEPNKDPSASVTLTVGLEKPTVTVNRSTVPVPRLETADDAGSYSITADVAQDDISNAGPVDIVITIFDPNRNNSTINQEVLVPTTAPDTGSNNVHTFDNGRLLLTLTPAPNQVFPHETVIEISEPIQETGFNTGVFVGTVTVHADDNDVPAWIGAKLKIEYKGLSLTDSSDDANTVTVTFNARQAVLTTDTSTIVNGGQVTFRVADPDSNRDPEDTESVYVRILWDDPSGTPHVDWLELEETGDDTGVFEKTVTVGDETIGDARFSVEADSEVEVFYYDATPTVSPSLADWPTLGGSNGRQEKTLQVGAESGSLEIDITGNSVGPSASIDVTVFDTDENTNPNTKQTINGLITIATDRGVEATLDVEETSGNSATFVGTLKLTPDPSPNTDGTAVSGDGTTEVTIEVLPGDIVSVRYEDQNDASGRRTTISKEFMVVSVDPEITLDRDVLTPGEQVTITVSDIDADTDTDSNDIITVKATSSSDLVGLSNVQLIETGPNTGVFVGTLSLTTQFSSGSLLVRNGDIVTIRYTDKFPADYADRVDAGGTTSKDFVLTAPVGSAITSGSTTPSTPVVRDSQNNPVTQVLAGQQVVLSSTIKNNEDAPTPYAAIVEVRDSDGVTVYLQWQTGTLPANGSNNVGVSWTPDEPGTYTIRVFVLSDLNNPQILSSVVTSTVTVS